MSVPEAVLALARLQPEAMLLLSRRGEIVFANVAARDALGLTESSSSDVLSTFTVESSEVIEEILRMWARSCELLPAAFRVRRRSSAEPVSYRCKGALLLSRLERAEGALLMCRFEPREAENPFVLLNQTIAVLTSEVTRRRQSEDALRRSETALRERAAEAETANRLKDEFLAALSHELRTPLNAILGWTLMLRQGLPEERRLRAIDTIERNARAQVQLIEELLDVTRIVAGKLRLNVQQIDPVQFVQHALETVTPAATAKGIRLHAVLDPLAGPISGDPDRMQQVIWNLLSNAVKFSTKGGRVEVLLERVNSTIEITITDSGQGIAPEFLPHVFERFRQADGGTTRAHGGLGLGLAIAKNIVELHGGTIEARSAGLGAGATFIVSLPLTVLVRNVDDSRPFASASTAETPADVFGPPEIAGLRIVAVDDEPDAVQLLATLLETCGATVRTARNAPEAIELVKSVLPDVLVSDIGMPGEDGYALIRNVRKLSRSEGGDTFAVALTAFARTEDRTRALTAGFHAHVPKPVEPTELLAVIASLVRRR